MRGAVLLVGLLDAMLLVGPGEKNGTFGIYMRILCGDLMVAGFLDQRATSKINIVVVKTILGLKTCWKIFV